MHAQRHLIGTSFDILGDGAQSAVIDLQTQRFSPAPNRVPAG